MDMTMEREWKKLAYAIAAYAHPDCGMGDVLPGPSLGVLNAMKEFETFVRQDERMRGGEMMEIPAGIQCIGTGGNWCPFCNRDSERPYFCQVWGIDLIVTDKCSRCLTTYPNGATVTPKAITPKGANP